jgi:outer membrane protein OmpA-like peptidoglycan-associated protein
MKHVSISALVMLTVCALVAQATTTISSGGHEGSVSSQSGDPLGAGKINVGGALNYGQEWEYIQSISPLMNHGSPRMLSGNGYFGIGVTDAFDLGLNLPAYYDDPEFGDHNAKGVGDLELSAKLACVGAEKPVTLSCYVGVQFPTGSKTDGFFPRHAYYGTKGNWSAEKVIFHPMIASTIHFERCKSSIPLRLNLNLGGICNAQSDGATAAIGLEWFPLEWMTLFTDVSAEEQTTTVHKDHFFADLINDPIFITPGIKFTCKNGMYFTLAGDIGISESDKAYAQLSNTESGQVLSHQANMLYNVLVAIGWEGKLKPRDSDGDGIIDKLDKCPNQAGPAENQGCPDVDSDGDGIIDRLDKCPKQAGRADLQGCPDVDSDGDGIPDRLDKCPTVAEDKDGFEDSDGCPDYDNDKDGIPDSLDKCPNQAGIVENSGCPDVDSDGDGIVDRLDKCPKNPGPAETQGCPVTKQITREGLILKGVTFESGKATLKPSSSAALDEVVTSLREWPEVNLEIQGHTDNIGSAKMNKTLSQDRAETVKAYFVAHGIGADRLTAIGYGPEVPVADNKTAAGREKNRRVELKRAN